MLRQQLDVVDREAQAAASATEAHDQDVAAAEQAAQASGASRRPRQSRSPSARRSQTRLQGTRQPSLRSSSPRTFCEVLLAPPPAYKQSPEDATVLDAHLSDFSHHVQHSFTKRTRIKIHIAATALLETFEPYPAATLRHVLRHIEAATAPPALTTAAHSLVATPRRAHSVDGRYDAAWPVHATPATGAPASSPRRQHDGTPPCRGRRDNGRQGRSGDSYSSSSDGDGSSRGHRSSTKKIRRTGERLDTSNISSARTRLPKPEEQKEDRDSSSEVAAARPPGESSHLWSMFPLVQSYTYFVVVCLPLPTVSSLCLLRMRTRDKHK